jgi:hypothetical protein
MNPVYKRNLLVFCTLALLSGWLGLAFDQQFPSPNEGESLGMGIWIVLPLITVLLIRWIGKEGWRDLKLKPNVREKAKWYGFSVLVFPLVTCIILGLGAALGWLDFSNFRGAAYAQVLLASILPSFIKNIFEEAVWRGYLAQRLIDIKLSDTWIYLIVGGIWGLWHAPYYLHFLPKEMMWEILPVSPWMFMLIATFSMIGWSVLFVEMYRLTNTIWSVVVLHTVEDAVINHLLIDGHVQILSDKKFLISPVAGLLTTCLYLAVGLYLRAQRKKMGR